MSFASFLINPLDKYRLGSFPPPIFQTYIILSLIALVACIVETSVLWKHLAVVLAFLVQMGIYNGLIQLCSKLFNPPCDFLMISIVNKSYNIECCVNKMFQINNNFENFGPIPKLMDADLI